MGSEHWTGASVGVETGFPVVVASRHPSWRGLRRGSGQGRPVLRVGPCCMYPSCRLCAFSVLRSPLSLSLLSSSLSLAVCYR